MNRRAFLRSLSLSAAGLYVPTRAYSFLWADASLIAEGRLGFEPDLVSDPDAEYAIFYDSCEAVTFKRSDSIVVPESMADCESAGEFMWTHSGRIQIGGWSVTPDAIDTLRRGGWKE